MRLAERLAADALEKIAGDGFARCERQGVHQAVEAVPMFSQLLKQLGDLGIARDFAGQRGHRTQLLRHVLGAIAEALVLVGESNLRAFAPRRLGNAVGDRAVGEEAGDEDALAGEQGHRPIILSPP